MDFELLFIVPVIVTLLCFCSLSLWVIYMHHRYSHIPGPTRDSFFMGNLPAIKRRLSNGALAEIICDWLREFGPVICVWLTIQPVVFVGDAAAIRDIIVVKDYPKSKRFYSMLKYMFKERAMGNGLVPVTDMEAWKKMRLLVNPAFHRTYLKSLLPLYVKSSDIFVKKLRAVSNGKTVGDMSLEFRRVSLDVMTKAAFGMNLNIIVDDSEPFSKATGMLFKGLHFKNKNPFYLIDFRTYSYQNEIDACTKFLRNCGKECVEQKQKLLIEGKELPNDIMSMIIEQADSSLTEEALVDEFITFIIAGSDTTSNMMSFLLLAVCSNPRIQEKLTEEVLSVLGKRTITEFNDLGKLVYLGQCIKETLRLYTTVNGLPRVASEETEYGGYSIPKGTVMAIEMYAMHRDPKYWSEPEVFNPERWDSDSLDKQGPNVAYMPFSAGRRNCVGRIFAEFEAKVVLASLIRNFHVSLVPGTKIALKQAGTIKPKFGVPVTLLPRL
eukprot:Seg6.9 transcript_id=Seg6.9/GoldUCD/mRNA.D3Y31 product="Cholesterol 24-hydroxylase" protein_id=Seg6.9/GoldUCD/D3Y31